jgi:hypothetical protein
LNPAPARHRPPPPAPQRRKKLKEELGLPDDYGVGDSDDDGARARRVQTLAGAAGARLCSAAAALWQLQRGPGPASRAPWSQPPHHPSARPPFLPRPAPAGERRPAAADPREAARADVRVYKSAGGVTTTVSVLNLDGDR